MTSRSKDKPIRVKQPGRDTRITSEPAPPPGKRAAKRRAKHAPKKKVAK